MNFTDEFRKYAVKHKGISSVSVDSFVSAVRSDYISPTIIEERQLNIATMDVDPNDMEND